MAIETGRLLLRAYTEADLAALAGLLGDAATMGFWPRPFTPAEAEAWLRRNVERRATSIYGRLAVVLKAGGELIGDAGVVRAELAGAERDDLGYILHRRHWGRGYATEAGLALAGRYLGEHGLPRLYANMAHDHVASQRVAERLGMRRVLSFENARNRNILTYLYVLERPPAGGEPHHGGTGGAGRPPRAASPGEAGQEKERNRTDFRRLAASILLSAPVGVSGVEM